MIIKIYLRLGLQRAGQVFQLDAVLKSRTRKGVKEHFVHWFGWDKKYDTWITDDQLQLFRIGGFYCCCEGCIRTEE